MADFVYELKIDTTDAEKKINALIESTEKMKESMAAVKLAAEDTAKGQK